MKTAHYSVASRSRQSGFTIVEMMVALAISMVVMLGFSVIFVNIKRTFVSQDQMSQLQDNERLAMTMLTTASNEAGYYPLPATLLPSQITADTDSTYGNMASAQAISGTSGTSPASDTLSIAFATSANDGLLTCQGHTIVAADITGAGSAAGGSVSIRDIFYVDATNKTLNCMVKVNGGTASSYGGGTGVPLISGVSSMTVVYGIDGGGGSVVGYYPASGITGTAPLVWTNVKTARVTLNFVNPNDSTSTIPWVQTINLLNNN